MHTKKMEGDSSVAKFGRILHLAGAVALACMLSVPVYAAGGAKAEIIAFEHKCIQAQTTDQAMACFDKNDVEIYDFVPPLKYSGEQAVRKDLAHLFDNATDINAQFLELKVVTDGKLGIVNSIQRFTWKDKSGKALSGNFRVTDCLHKVDGKWKIFHSHLSVPIDPATGKAVMDAKM
jgi:ketosteroid isomerase-like protein